MPHRLQPVIPAALACALALALPASAEQVYKWVDDKGVTHFSQTPPDKEPSQTLDVRTAPATAPESAAAGAKKDADAKPQRTDEQRKQRAERCKGAQEALAKLEGSEPIVRYGEKGEQIPVADDERPKYIEQVKKVMAQQCGE
jgi:hypothetical protein